MLDISTWPISSIMQLPDAAMGSRFVINVSVFDNSGNDTWAISELALPEQFILWEVEIMVLAASGTFAAVRLHLGDKEPTSVAQMTALEPLIPGWNWRNGSFRGFRVWNWSPYHLTGIKAPIRAKGRRLVFEMTNLPPEARGVSASIIISTIPTEIPDMYAGFPKDDRDELLRLVRLGVKFPK